MWPFKKKKLSKTIFSMFTKQETHSLACDALYSECGQGLVETRKENILKWQKWLETQDDPIIIEAYKSWLNWFERKLTEEKTDAENQIKDDYTKTKQEIKEKQMKELFVFFPKL